MIRKKIVTYGPTWGCGYTEGSARMQYTGTSFASSLADLASPVVPGNEEYQPIRKNEIFPSPRTFTSGRNDFLKKLTGIVSDRSMFLLKYLARLQTGHIQHYILYAFVFILVIFLLLYLGLI
jgi:hypothetical protein